LKKLYEARGLNYWSLNNREKALEDFTRMLEGDGKTSRAYFLRGRVLAELGHFQEAVRDFSAALDRQPEHYDSLLNRGWAYGCLREFDRSIQDFSAILWKHPDDLIARGFRGWAYNGMDDLTSAEADLTHGLRKGSREAWLYLQLADVYYARDKIERALEVNEKALQLRDENYEANALFQRGGLLLMTGRVEEALKVYEQGIVVARKAGKRAALEDVIGSLRQSMEKDPRSKDTTMNILKKLEEARDKLPPEVQPDLGACQITPPHPS
jgi:tetratricopeptide (TPR) repeat protein